MAIECEKCMNEQRIIVLEKDSERNSKQHKEFYDAVKNGAVQQMKNETVYNQIFSTLSDIKSDINELKSTPKRRWDTLIGALITTIVGIMVGVALKGGLGG